MTLHALYPSSDGEAALRAAPFSSLLCALTVNLIHPVYHARPSIHPSLFTWSSPPSPPAGKRKHKKRHHSHPSEPAAAPAAAPSTAADLRGYTPAAAPTVSPLHQPPATKAFPSPTPYAAAPAGSSGAAAVYDDFDEEDLSGPPGGY